jgi:hypothetical protein
LHIHVNASFTKLKKRSRDHKLKKKNMYAQLEQKKKKRTADTPGFVSLIIVRIINQTIVVK